MPRQIRWRQALPAIALCCTAAASLAGDTAERPLLPFSAPDGPATIVAFGTSLTAGELWPAELAAALSRCFERPVDVEAVAVPGAGSSWALEAVGQVADYQPDLVVIEFAINDADILDGVSLTESRAAHEMLIDRLQAADPDIRILLMTMNPVDGVVRKLQRPFLGRYYAMYRDLAEEHDLGLADFEARWLSDPAALRAALTDGLHPDPQAAAALMAPVLTRMIAAAAQENRAC